MNRDDPNVVMVETIAAALGSLRERLVLVGGCAAGLLFTDPGAAPPRATMDVDLLAEVAALPAYHALEREFEALGFVRDMAQGAPICRWRLKELTVDLMPSDAAVLGFSNRWYPEAIATANRVALPSGQTIRLISAPAFMATKLVAFADRGKGDFLASHDLEDVINLLLARTELADEIATASVTLRAYLAQQCEALLGTPNFHDGLQGLVMPDAQHQAMVAQVIARMRLIASG